VQVLRLRADHRNAQTIDVKNYVRLRSNEAVAVPGNIRGDNRVVGMRNEFAGTFPSVIELVIAERGGSEAEEIAQFIKRKSFEDGRHWSALDQVARIEKDAIGTILALLADDRGQIGEAALPVFEWREPGVEIVGMEDRERSYFGREMEGKEEEDGQEAFTAIVAFPSL